MSQLGGDLKPGLDCPVGAAFLDGTLWNLPGGVGAINANVSQAKPYKAFCVFEQPLDGSHWRHLQLFDKRVDGVPASQLVVRAVTAVGNYDYVTQFSFGLAGGVRVGFEFAGYMETRWFSPDTTPFERPLGEVVRTNLAAPLHSHFGCFKVDLDASPAGESFELTTITSGVKQDSGVPNPHRWATKYVVREYPSVEGVNISTFAPSAAKPTVWAVVDNAHAAAATAPSGKPGYSISLGPTVLQTLPAEHPFVKATAFSKYPLAIARRKEEEPRPSSVYDLFGPGELATLSTRVMSGTRPRHVETCCPI